MDRVQDPFKRHRRAHVVTPPPRPFPPGREIPEIPSCFPPQVATLLNLCFAFNPYQRPTFKQLHEAFLSPWHAPTSSCAPVSFSSGSPETLREMHDAFSSPWQDHPSSGAAPQALNEMLLKPISNVFESLKGERATPRAPPRTHSRNALLPPPPEQQAPPEIAATLREDITEAERTVTMLYQVRSLRLVYGFFLPFRCKWAPGTVRDCLSGWSKFWFSSGDSSVRMAFIHFRGWLAPLLHMLCNHSCSQAQPALFLEKVVRLSPHPSWKRL